MENRKESSDGEDLPSDFFDDFAKEDFIEGLSVIDSWDDESKKPSNSRTRTNAGKIDRVKDLRELIDSESQDRGRDYERYEDRAEWRHRNQGATYEGQSLARKRQRSENNLDNFIKPGSRRDPSKTNEAIKKDKEVKVKEYLVRHLESSDDLRPPGTELDDYFEENKNVDIRRQRAAERKITSQSPLRKHSTHPIKYRRESPIRRRDSPPRYNYHHRMAWSPRRHYSPVRSPRHSPHRNPRQHASHKSFRAYHRGSPRRRSPAYTHRERRSRSPFQRRSRSPSDDCRIEREVRRKSRSQSSHHMSGNDDFLYPKIYQLPSSSEYPGTSEMQYQVAPASQYAAPTPVEYSYPEHQAPGYTYAPGPAYSGYGSPYEYEQTSTMAMPEPQPVPAPMIESTAIDSATLNPIQHMLMVPTPQQTTSNITPNTPTGALAKLVTDGKLSHEDYLKLAPEIGVPLVMDTQTRVTVLTRCHDAISRLSNISLPNRLLINNEFIGNEQKQIVSKFCSPLKRQAVTDFYFTKFNPSAIAQQNKQIVDSVVAALNIEAVVGKVKKKPPKETREVAVQTTKPFCEMCEIRCATEYNEVGTSAVPEHFKTSVHTSVVEQDLYSSRAVFNPTGGAAEGANMSIAHMTPAQLVSQLAARAKTLKQTEPPPAQHRHDSRYNYDGRDLYKNNNNYHY